jgi:hypothetical protein
MNRNEIIILVLIIIVIVVVIYLSFKGAEDSCDSCGDACTAHFEDCQTGCSNCGDDCGQGCDLGCLAVYTSCTNNCYPPCQVQYSIRNGCVFSMNFINSSGVMLGSLGGWSPYKIKLDSSDFPVVCCYNSTDAKKCGGYVIKDPGCYILWFFSGYYTTNEICYSK